jgi:cysteinyl-tRNA synthetase
VLRLYDTASGDMRTLSAGSDGRIGLYVCGPTVYGPPHIGHGRATLVYDVLRRYLEWSGVPAHHVANVTDIDDKIIRLAAEEGRPWQEVAEQYEASWWEATDRMGLWRPHDTPHATDYIDDMVEMIARLVQDGAAYETGDGVYFSTSVVPDYGLLAHQAVESLRAGARVEVNEEKRAPIDFVLWKKSKPGEPIWPSPWGDGRPGWHTECVVMSLDLLGDGFLHGGGEDLKFPHHENERAQAVALHRPFANHWMHHGMVLLGDEKMSKSLGNVVDLRGVLDTHDPRAYRLVILQAHYREPVKVDEPRLAEATRTLQGIDALARRIGEAAPEAGDVPPSEAVLEAFRTHMDDDLGSPRAVAGLFEAARSANTALDRRETAEGVRLGTAALQAFESLGLVPVTTGDIAEEAKELARSRDEARAARDFATADRLRDEIVALGYRVEDTPSGTRVLR